MRKKWMIPCVLALVLFATSCKKDTIDMSDGKNLNQVYVKDSKIDTSMDAFEVQKIVFENIGLPTLTNRSVENYLYEKVDEKKDGVSTKQTALSHLIVATLDSTSLNGNYIYYENNLNKTVSQNISDKDTVYKKAKYKSFTSLYSPSLYFIDYAFKDSNSEEKEKKYSNEDLAYEDFDLNPKPLMENYGSGKDIDLSQTLIPRSYYYSSFKLTDNFIILKNRYLFNFDKFVSNMVGFDFELSKSDGEYLYETYYFDYKNLECVSITRESYTIDADSKYQDYKTVYKKEIGKVFDGNLLNESVESFLTHQDEVGSVID